MKKKVKGGGKRNEGRGDVTTEERTAKKKTAKNFKGSSGEKRKKMKTGGTGGWIHEGKKKPGRGGKLLKEHTNCKIPTKGREARTGPSKRTR